MNHRQTTARSCSGNRVDLNLAAGGAYLSELSGDAPNRVKSLSCIKTCTGWDYSFSARNRPPAVTAGQRETARWHHLENFSGANPFCNKRTTPPNSSSLWLHSQAYAARKPPAAAARLRSVADVFVQASSETLFFFFIRSKQAA